jgi:hypothetical protein
VTETEERHGRTCQIGVKGGAAVRNATARKNVIKWNQREWAGTSSSDESNV